MTEYRVGEIMRTDGPTLTPENPIRSAVAALVEAKAAAAPVLEQDGRLVGILTQKDCFRPALHAAYYQDWMGQVSGHMTREVVTVDINDEAMRIAELFIDSPHRLFPVLDGSAVRGLLHRSDMLALLARIG